MSTLQKFPMVSQRSTVTSDGKPSEDALFECVPASIGACMLWLEGKSQWDSTINPDKMKDSAYGEAYTGGTSASNYVAFCKSLGFHLYSVDGSPDASHTVAVARQLLAENKPAIFTEIDPYVDTNLPQYAGWTHVCCWFSDDANGLTALDPFIAQPVYKSDSTWAGLLRANQIWTVERIATVNIPQGWHDDGTTLTAPNGVKVVHGFRDYILSHNWDSANEPLASEYATAQLEDSNTALGNGTQQLFRLSMLGWTASRGVFEEWIGTELAFARRQVAKYYALIQQLQQQVTTLQAPANPTLLSDMQQIKTVSAKY